MRLKFSFLEVETFFALKLWDFPSLLECSPVQNFVEENNFFRHNHHLRQQQNIIIFYEKEFTFSFFLLLLAFDDNRQKENVRKISSWLTSIFFSFSTKTRNEGKKSLTRMFQKNSKLLPETWIWCFEDLKP